MGWGCQLLDFLFAALCPTSILRLGVLARRHLPEGCHTLGSGGLAAATSADSLGARPLVLSLRLS